MHGSTSLNLTLHYYGSTSLYFTLHYYDSTSFCLILRYSTFALYFFYLNLH